MAANQLYSAFAARVNHWDYSSRPGRTSRTRHQPEHDPSSAPGSPQQAYCRLHGLLFDWQRHRIDCIYQYLRLCGLDRSVPAWCSGQCARSDILGVNPSYEMNNLTASYSLSEVCQNPKFPLLLSLSYI